MSRLLQPTPTPPSHHQRPPLAVEAPAPVHQRQLQIVNQPDATGSSTNTGTHAARARRNLWPLQERYAVHATWPIFVPSSTFEL